MAIVVKDRVKQSAAAPGTGTITLGSVVSGFQGFSAIGDTNTTYFAIVDTAAGTWEVNYGVYDTGTLTRNATPLSSSSAGALVNFTGAVDVFCTYPSSKAIYEEITGNVLIDGGPITVLGSGVSPGSYTSFGAVLAEMYGNVDTYAQSYARNISTDVEASADMIVYRDNTAVDTANFLDMGINSQFFSSTTWPIFTEGSMYLYGNGGEMFIGSETSDLIFFVGGVQTTDEVARFSHTTGELTTRESINVTGDVNAQGGTFTAAVTTSSPSASSPANNEFVTKAYVDNATSTGIHIHEPVVADTNASLSAVYTQGGTTFNITDITGTNTVVTSTTHGLSVNNQIWLTSAGNGLSTNTPYFVYATPTGTSLQLSTSYDGPLLTGLTNASGLTYATRANSGVGSFLEASANEALPIADVIVGDRVLIYNQSTGYWNGVYTVTSLGSGASKWKLTRATDANYYSPADTNGLSEGDYFFVQSNSESYVLTTPGAIIIGYTSITYTLFSSVPVYTGTSPIDVTGTVISLTTVPATLGGTGTGTTTTGDMLYGGSSANTWSKLGIGSTYNILRTSAGGIPEWGAVNLASSDAVTGTLGATYGGTSQNSYTLGDTLYSSATNTLAKLAGNTTTTKKFLTQTGTGAVSDAPAWGTISGSDVSGNISGSAGSVANALTLGTYLTGTSFNGSSAVTATVDATSANTASKVVARDGSGDFSAGTITAALSGNATTATTATNVAGGAANKLVYQSGSGTTAFANAPSASGQNLQWNGSAFTWVAPTAGATQGFAVGMSLVFGR